MSLLRIANFGGMVPSRSAALLPDNAAQVAQNCVLWHGDLRPLKAPLPVITPTAIQGVIKSIYRMGQASANETQYWLAWSSDVDVVRGMIANDTAERTIFTGSGVPKITNLQMATQGGTAYPVNSYALGVIAPVDRPICTPSNTSGPIEQRSYLYTYVTAWGEEGVPSLTTLVNVSENGAVSIALNPAPMGNYNIVSKRIYRSQLVAGGGGVYEFVAEVADAQAIYNDTKKASELGEVLSTADYEMPPSNLAGIVAMPNGIIAGFSGNDLCFCEPFLPYAWPSKYKLITDYPIVGLGAFGSSLLVCTTGSPYVVTGVHPDSMSMEKIELEQACVSKKSIVSVGGGVMYASPDGLVYVGSGGSRVVTQGLFTREEWQSINPSSISGYYHDGKYVAAYQTGGGFILNSLEDASLTLFDDVITAGYTDLVRDALYLCIGGSIKKFNAGAKKLYTWKSKKFQLRSRPPFSFARVDAEFYPLTFNLYADGQLQHAQTVNNEFAFRLPGGYRAREMEIELIGVQTISMVTLGDTPQEMRV